MWHSLALRLALLVSCLLGLAGGASAQTTWYVDVNAVPPGNGAQATPFSNIQFAITRPTTVAGDTVLVLPGTYYESLSIDKAITVKSSSGPLQTILLSSGGFDGVEIFGPSLNATVLEGFTVVANTQLSGIYLSPGTVRGCIVRDCTSLFGIECVEGKIESSTVVRNNKGVVQNGSHGWGFPTVLRNSIIWGNSQSNFEPSGLSYDAAYCAGFNSSGAGSIPGDPVLWDLAGGDFHLRPGSPCIDAGDPISPLDPDGSRIDIGALTYDASYAPGPSPYCTGKLNSQGCTPAIGATGMASATQSSPFVITAVNEPSNKAGLLFFGFGKRAVPFQGGVYCVDLPIKRVGGQNSGGSGPCGGVFSFDMQAYIQSGLHAGLIPGALVYGQWWNRDPLDPAGYGSGLSNAIHFGIAP